MKTVKRYAVWIAYFLIYVVWGSTYYFIGVALHGFPTFLLGALRFSMAGVLLLFLCFIRGEQVFRLSPQRYVSSSVVAIVASSTALWIMVFDIPMWKKTFSSVTTVVGLLLGFIGVGMLYVEQMGKESAVYQHGEYGILILVAGCISWSLGSLYAKYRSSAVEGINGFAGSAWQMLSAGIMFWLCSGLSNDWEEVDFQTISQAAWLSLIYLVTFGSLLAYSAYVWLLKVRPATEVATHAYVNPVVAVVIGGLGGEDITFIQLIGLAVILCSVMLVNKKKTE